jgi:hypothetical protein
VPLFKALNPHARSQRAAIAILGLVTVIFVLKPGWDEFNAANLQLVYRDTQVELVLNAHNVCGPTRTVATGEMSVPVDYFDISTAGRVFQVTQARHETCDSKGCPIRVFILNPDGSRGLLANASVPLVNVGSRGKKNPNLLISRNGHRLISGNVEVELVWN